MYDSDDEQPWPSGLVPDGEIRGAPIEAVEQRLAQLERTEEARAAAAAAAADREVAARERTVTCEGCGVQLPRSDSFYSSRGVVCPACHAADE